MGTFALSVPLFARIFGCIAAEDYNLVIVIIAPRSLDSLVQVAVCLVAHGIVDDIVALAEGAIC